MSEEVTGYNVPDRAAVERLKAKWRNTPTWKLEESKGFEAWALELKCYRLEQESAIRKSRPRPMVDHRPAHLQPRGLLHDAGEVTVITRHNRRTTHRHALVVVFDDIQEMEAAIAHGRCQYITRTDPEAV